MESEKAYRSLLKVSKEKKFNKLEKYLQQSKLIEIKLSSLPLVLLLVMIYSISNLALRENKDDFDKSLENINNIEKVK